MVFIEDRCSFQRATLPSTKKGLLCIRLLLFLLSAASVCRAYGARGGKLFLSLSGRTLQQTTRRPRRAPWRPPCRSPWTGDLRVLGPARLPVRPPPMLYLLIYALRSRSPPILPPGIFCACSCISPRKGGMDDTPRCLEECDLPRATPHLQGPLATDPGLSSTVLTMS